MKLLLAILTAVLLFQFEIIGVKAQDEPPHIAYTKHFLRAYPKRLKRAIELMPTVDGYSAIHAIDPLIPVIVISCESAWHTNRPGEIGEQGLMQVHGACARGYDLSVPEQQIQAGIACLAKAREACDGSIRQMLTMYQSGSCKPRTAKTKRRINHRVWIIKKWKKESTNLKQKTSQ